MSRNDRVIEAPVEEIFRTLVKPLNCARWVIGSKIVRSVDDDWPNAGTAFLHAIGIGPIHVEDETREFWRSTSRGGSSCRQAQAPSARSSSASSSNQTNKGPEW